MSAVPTDVRRPIEDLSLPQLNQEIKQRFETAEQLMQKHKAGTWTPDDETEVKRLLEEVDQFEVVRGKKESFEQLRARVQAGAEAGRKPAEEHRQPTPIRERRRSPGTQFVESEEYRALADAGRLLNPHNHIEFGIQLKDFNYMLERKALLQGGDAASGGSFVIPEYYPGYTVLPQRPLTLLDLIARIPTTSDTIDWIKQTGFTNSAAMVAEATASTGTSGAKPESTLTFARETTPVETVAHYIPVTNRMLSDAPAIRGVIDAQLMLGLDLELETEIISGNGTSPNLDGILTDAGIQALGRGSDSNIDALFKAMVAVQVTGLRQPTAHIVHPLNWETMRLAREGTGTGYIGGYLLGPPSLIGATTLWGLPVVQSIGLTANTGLTGDFAATTMALFDREQTAVRVGYINDQFIRNMLTILAELRAAFTLFYPAGVAKTTGLN